MRLDELVPLVRKNISRTQRNSIPNGLICLKGGDLSDELRKTPGDPYTEPLSTYFSEPFFETKQIIYVPV